MRSFFYAYTNSISYKEGFLYLFRIIKKASKCWKPFLLFIFYL